LSKGGEGVSSGKNREERKNLSRKNTTTRGGGGEKREGKQAIDNEKSSATTVGQSRPKGERRARERTNKNLCLGASEAKSEKDRVGKRPGTRGGGRDLLDGVKNRPREKKGGRREREPRPKLLDGCLKQSDVKDRVRRKKKKERLRKGPAGGKALIAGGGLGSGGTARKPRGRAQASIKRKKSTKGGEKEAKGPRWGDIYNEAGQDTI